VQVRPHPLSLTSVPPGQVDPVVQPPPLHTVAQLCGVQQAVPPPHTPPVQVSPQVATFPSSQVVPSGLFGFEHIPVPVLQTPTLWHWSRAVHMTFDVWFPQTPLWQVSPIVHPSPSLQAVPLALFGFEHIPVPVLQIPTL
jgi:hypothetical protein